MNFAKAIALLFGRIYPKCLQRRETGDRRIAFSFAQPLA
jgi:hypothetical protein